MTRSEDSELIAPAQWDRREPASQGCVANRLSLQESPLKKPKEAGRELKGDLSFGFVARDPFPTCLGCHVTLPSLLPLLHLICRSFQEKSLTPRNSMTWESQSLSRAVGHPRSKAVAFFIIIIEAIKTSDYGIISTWALVLSIVCLNATLD